MVVRLNFDQPAAHAVHQAMSVHIPDEAAVAARDDVRRRIARRAGMRHRMQ